MSKCEKNECSPRKEKLISSEAKTLLLCERHTEMDKI